MANVLANLARMYSSTTGTGTLSLGLAVDGFVTFATAGVTSGQVVTYCIEDYDTNGNVTGRELGQGTYTGSGTTLSRTTIYRSTTGAALNCSGRQQVFITVAAEDLAALQNGDRGDITVSGTTWTIDTGAVSLDKIAQPSANTIIGKASTGNLAALSANTTLTLIDGATNSLSASRVSGVLVSSTTSTQNGYFGDIYLRDDTNPSHYLQVTNANDLSANRTLSLNMNDGSRTLSMTGNLTVPSAATVSGTNTGDQTITLTGDVTGSGGGSFAATIAANAVDLTKMADVATGTVFYRKTASTGDPEVQTLATLKTDLGLTGTNSGDQTITLTGDVTGSGSGSFSATIASGAVSLAKMANVATGTVFYRKTASTGVPEVQTLATLKTDLGLTGTNSGDQTISITGDITASGSTGALSAAISAGVIVDADVNSSAAIDSSKLNFLQSGTGASARTVQSALRERRSITDFGAVSGADSSTAIQAAIDAVFAAGGGEVLVPRGTYIINATINLKGDVSLIGEGSGCSILKAKNSLNANVVQTDGYATNVGSGNWTVAQIPHEFRLCNIQIDGNKANQTSGNGLALYGKRFMLHDIVVHSCKGIGILSDGWLTPGNASFPEMPENIWFRVDVNSCDSHGIQYRGPTDASMWSVFSHDNGGWGMRFESNGTTYRANSDVTFAHIYANTLGGVYVSADTKMRFIHLCTESNFAEGLIDDSFGSSYDYLECYRNCRTTGTYSVKLNGSAIEINRIWNADGSFAKSGVLSIGSYNRINSGTLNGDSSTGVGITVSGSYNHFACSIYGYSGAGGVGAVFDTQEPLCR